MSIVPKSKSYLDHKCDPPCNEHRKLNERLKGHMKLRLGPYGDPITIEEVQSYVGPGWSKIIADLIKDLETLGWNGQVDQVKEKFGGLRFYVSEATDSMLDRIERAETDSMNICEFCGDYGELRGMKDGFGWMKVACDKCAELHRATTIGEKL